MIRPDEISMMAELTQRAADVLLQLQRCLDPLTPAAELDAVRTAIADLETDTRRLTFLVQQAIMESWIAQQPTRQTRPIKRPPLSTDFLNPPPIDRLPAAPEEARAPVLSGKWNRFNKRMAAHAS